MTSPILSVVIPTHNRRAALLEHLAILWKQTTTMPGIEILVVADCCDDGTEAAVEEWAARTGLDLRVLSHRARSASATRNLGARAARSPTLLFVDDDIEPLQGFIRFHLDAHKEDDARAGNMAVLGYSKPIFPAPLTLWQKEARLWWLDIFHAMEAPGYRFTYRNFFSGNVSLPRALFERVGGFNEELARLEDYEFGLRWFKAGGKLRYDPQACGLHREGTHLPQWLQRIRQEGAADLRTAEMHPEMRSLLWWPTQRQTLVTTLLRKAAFRYPKKGDRLVTAVAVTAESAAWLGLRGLSRRLVSTTRSYQYFRGVASLKNFREFAAWLQDGPPPVTIQSDAPVLDMASLPNNVDEILALGSERGLRIVYNGVELRTLAPLVGAEPLRMDHVAAFTNSCSGKHLQHQMASDLR